MIEIKIDYNMDRIVVFQTDDPTPLLEYNVKKSSMNELEKIIYEIINCIEGDPSKPPYIKLSKIDEDTETTIEEW